MTVSFADLGVRPDLVARLHARGLTDPFPIQEATLPDALAGRDVCGRAPTGIGEDPGVRIGRREQDHRVQAGPPRGAGPRPHP